MEGRRFGQKVPPLSVYLKDVLDKYPEGGQILKELVQNADDAEASKVVFLYDKSQHATETLLSCKLKEFQGPALYAFNDAVFQDEDWKNIQHPQHGSKVEDLEKVGRFGLGFISVYHLTDMPCIVSNDSIAFFDPLQKYFDPGSPGKMWNLSADLVQKFPHQFSPFMIDLPEISASGSCKSANFLEGKFKGTLFRFPLRMNESSLSKSTFEEEGRIKALLESFWRDADISLLFLNHVKSISVYERESLTSKPRLIFKVSIQYEDGKRSNFLSQVVANQDCQSVKFAVIKKQHGPYEKDSETQRYVTANLVQRETTSPELNALINDGELKLLPWIGVALQVDTSTYISDSPRGRVFCFLPLPESECTGLPVHVHGYFGLGDNRRSIKWPDSETLHDKKAQWNQLLVTEIFPQVYAQVILSAIERTKNPKDIRPEDVYNGWPCVPEPGRIHTNWEDGVKAFLKLMTQKAVFYTDCGSWRKPSDDVYVNSSNVSLLAKVLKHKHCPVVHLPDHVEKSLEWAGIPYKKVTAELVKNRIRGDPLHFLTREEKLELLKYVTADDITDLTNIHLLPLQNGRFTSFSKNNPTVFIASDDTPSTLIPNGGSKFADDLPETLTQSVWEIETFTQLRFLSDGDVGSLVREMLPGNWRNGKEPVVSWTPNVNMHPPKEWLETMWKWLVRNRVCLDQFYFIPLIPVNPESSQIARLQENKLIFRQQLSNNICSFLQYIGVVVVECDCRFVRDHPEINNCIKPPTSEGVMALLEAAHQKGVNVSNCVQRLTSEGKEELKDLLAQLWNLTNRQKGILKQLPFFMANNGQYIAANCCSAAIPSDYYEIPVKRIVSNSHLILLRWRSDELALSLGVERSSVFDILEKNYLPALLKGHYSNSDSLKIMTWTLERREFDDLVRELKFVPTSVGQKKSPSELFDPVETLQVLLKDNSLFPGGEYAKGRLLEFLKRIGLKEERDVTAADLLKVAEAVSKTRMGQTDVRRGTVLFEFINNDPHLKLFDTVTHSRITKELWKFLVDLYWIPCHGAPPEPYPASAGWAGDGNTLYKPSEVGLIESSLLQGSVMPLIKLLDINVQLKKTFGWSENPDPENYNHVKRVVQHLRNVATHFQADQEMYTVSHCVSKIYAFLGEASDDHITEIFHKHLTDEPWVWHGSGFTSLDKVALTAGTLGVNLVPYLHIIPDDMQKFKSFFAKRGVKETFQESALCSVLVSVKDKHNTYATKSSLLHRWDTNAKDYERDLNLVCNILKYIVRHDIDVGQKFHIWVPCRVAQEKRHLVMASASECLYVDEERLAKQLDFSKPVMHETLSNDVAQHLRLQPLSHVIAPVELVNYEIAGPYESTVNAIKRNLDMYKEGVDIFRELIQNADDAGATEVKFLIDWRTNEDTAHDLISEGMKDCHGPALWAYNNACFTDSDINNILSIGAQSKKLQLDKVGRFGLGFTSVYHLTDIPSVVSGPYVLISDPRTIHLGDRVKPGQPGIKLDLRNESHQSTLKTYPNQFHPYQGIFGCNISNSFYYHHTLFRLPLRTNAEADSKHPNQLSDSVYESKSEVDKLIEFLKKSLATLLLFTQNVTHVSLFETRQDSTNAFNMTDAVPILSVNLSLVQQLPRSISGSPDVSTERNLLKATHKYMESNHHTLPVPETTMIVKVTQETQTAKSKNKQTKKDQHFIVSSCMATNKVLEMARSPEGQKAGVLPCGGVAAQLASRGTGLEPEEDIRGQLYSYLPLDVSTGLRFHANGSFLLQPNRRQLWSKPSAQGEFETRWNICFMESVLCKAFVNMLLDLQHVQDQKNDNNVMVNARNFQSLWPRRQDCESDFYPFVDAFYQNLSTGKTPPLIFNHNQWVSVQSCFFTDWNENDPQKVRNSVKALLTTHQQYVRSKHNGPKGWVDLDPKVVHSIDEAGAKACFDDGTFCIKRFLDEVFFRLLRSDEYVEPYHRDVIVLHVLDLRLGERKVSDYDEDLEETDCIPASPDGEVLSSPKDLVNPESSVGELFVEEDGRFPHGDEYRTKARLLSMTELGMSSDDLPWKDVCERAEFLSTNANFNLESAKSVILLKLMDKKLRKKDDPTPEEREIIRALRFLPVLKKPKNYPADWYNSGCAFMSANVLYEAKCQHLLGSVQPLLDEQKLGQEALSNQVKSVLGFGEKKVTVPDAIQQFKVLANQTKEVTQEVSAAVFKVYEFLQEAVCVSGGHTLDVKDEYRHVVKKLATMRFVLCEKEFQSCNHVAFNYGGKSGPYLYEVPTMLKNRYGNLLKACSVKDKFDVEDFLDILQTIKEKYQDKPLHKADLAAAKELISLVSKNVGSHDNNGDSLLKGRVFVPDENGILRTPSELTINDMTWKDSTGMKAVYTHLEVTLHEARVFGIVSERERQLANCSSFKGFKTEFGQKEELTDRLSNILRSYSCVSDVFKELLQNADDAGSTEIHFVYDPRSHQTEKIIGESWEKIQTLPAICVYNNTPFSESDIEGIQKVGIGGKREDISATGKFGIGFNAVYHLTDCPSFLSGGHTLCVFDPLLKYVPGVQRESPGIRLEAGEHFRQTFPDMLTGYLEDKGDFGQRNGTMFRFPLRSRPSQISLETFVSFKVKNLISHFQNLSEEALLFLNNIKKISISHIDKQTGELKADYHIHAELSQEDQTMRQELTDHLKLFNENPCETVETLSRVYSLTTEDSSEVQQKWLISQVIGFVDLPSDQDISNDVGLKKPLPCGGVAALMSSTKGGRIQNLDQNYKAYCCLPLPIVTKLPVHVNGTFELDDARKNLAKGKDFVHGDADLEDGGLIHKWNSLLVKNVVAPAYAHLLLNAGRKILDPESTRLLEDIKSFDRLFPKHLKGFHGEWSILAEATLCYIGHKNLEVLPVVRNGEAISWHHPNSAESLAFFDDLSVQVHVVHDVQGKKEEAVSRMGKKEKESDVIRSFLLGVGFNLLASSHELCSAFKDSGIKAELVTPKSVVQHLLTNSGCTSAATSGLPLSLKETAFKDEYVFKTVFKYCLEAITSPVELNGLPLRLTNDGLLNTFSTTDGLYLTKHCKVLPCLNKHFLHAAVVKMCRSHFKENNQMDQAYRCGIFKDFTISELAYHMHKQLPDFWKDCEQHVQWTPGSNDQPPESWLRDLWAFIRSQMPKDKSPLSLEPISNWPIFPTTSGKLVPPSLSKTILFFPPSFDYQKQLVGVLRKLGLSEIAWDKMCSPEGESSKNVQQARKIPGDLEQLLTEQAALPTKQADVIGVIQFTLDSSGSLKDLSTKDGVILLKYFQEDENISEENIRTIKQLPLFSLQGKGEHRRTDLQQFQHYHTTDGYCIPDAENQKWKDQMSCAFLEPQPVYTLIYGQLGITQINQADIYLQYILPCFQLLSGKVKLEHIVFISKLKHGSNCEEKAFLEKLKLCRFIPDADGYLYRADHFYDPTNSVFKAMIPENKLLHKFMAENWALRVFLKKIGLHGEVSQEDFTNFVKEIEHRAKQNVSSDESKKLMDASKRLTEELDKNDHLCDQNFLRMISKIKFIPSVPIDAELLEIVPAFQTASNSKAPFIGYQGSVPEKHLELVWSVAPVLPYWAVPHTLRHVKGVQIKVTECLGIASYATLDMVLSHTQNVCGMMEQKNAFDTQDELSPKVRKMTKTIMQKILKYLSQNMDKYGQQIKCRLWYTPVCQVEEGRVFVKAEQIVFKMQIDELRPYLYSAPRDLGTFDKVFRLLGAQDFCTFDQLASILSIMKRSYGDQIPKDPNEKKKALFAISQIFNILIKYHNEKKPCEVSVTEFYIFNSEYHLRKSTELYYADPNVMEHLKLASTDKEFVLPLTQFGIAKTDEVKVIQLLPEKIRPKNLGDEMVEKPYDTNIDCPAGQHCEYLGHVRRMLNSEEMTRVLERLAKHQMESKQWVPNPNLEKCIRKLQNFDNFVCKTELQLGFYDASGITLLAKQNVSRKAYFDSTEDQILLEHQWPLKNHMSVNFRQIADCCNALVGRFLDSDHLSHLQNALDSPSPNEMNMALTAMRISEYDTTTQAIQQDDYELGAIIPLDIRHFLDRDLRNRFNVGDIIGYVRTLDDTAAAERVLDVEDDADVESEAMLLAVSTPLTEATEIIYAKIVGQIGENEEPGDLSQKYRIDIGQAEPITVSMASLYKFRPPKIPPEKTIAVSSLHDHSRSAGACSGSRHPEDLNKAKEQIKQQVREAFSIPKDEQKRVIHRLYFTWHPDKNPEQQELCTEAFKFLRQEIERRDVAQQYSQRYSAWEAEMKREWEEAKQYQERCSRNPNVSRQNMWGESYVPPSFTKETPDPRTARVWFRQAKEHLKAANQTSHLDQAWIAFKVHQAAETALKAAQYSLVGRSDATSNDLVTLARQVDQQRGGESREIQQKVSALIRLRCDFTKPRYPQNKETSGQAYQNFSARNAVLVCQELLDLVQDIIGIHVF